VSWAKGVGVTEEPDVDLDEAICPNTNGTGFWDGRQDWVLCPVGPQRDRCRND
jgi:hypothetical protein